MRQMKFIKPSYFMAPGFVPGYKLPGREFKAKEIIEIVAEYYDVDPRKLSWRTRSREIVIPRHVAMYFIRAYTPLTVTGTAKLFNRDHTSTLHAIRTVKDTMETDLDYRNKVNHLMNILLGT